MKRVLFLIAMGLLFCVQSAIAGIMDLADDASGKGYFYDANTGYTWMDTDNYVNMSFNAVERALQGTQFHIATYSELIQMHGDVVSQYPLPDNFDTLRDIMGTTWENTFGTGNIPYLWGIYDSGISDQWAGAWLGPYDLFQTTSWSYDTYSSTGATQYLDRDDLFGGQGAWILTTEPFRPSAPVPEPATLLLFGSGLAALIGLKRKFQG